MGPTQPSIDSTVIIIARLAGSSWFSKPTTTTTYFWPLLLYARAAGCCCITPFAVGQTNCPCAGYVSIDRARCAFRQSYICGKRVCVGGGVNKEEKGGYRRGPSAERWTAADSPDIRMESFKIRPLCRYIRFFFLLFPLFHQPIQLKLLLCACVHYLTTLVCARVVSISQLFRIIVSQPIIYNTFLGPFPTQQRISLSTIFFCL